MIETFCSCGVMIRAAEAAVGRAVRCKQCGHVIRIAAAEAVTPETALGDFDARLNITAGPDFVGDSIALGGVPDLTIGKVEGRHILLPSGMAVSRAHAKLVRVDFGPSRWKIVDTQSRNGVLVNGQQVKERELTNGDTVQIGDYKLRYLVGVPSEKTDSAAAMPSSTMAWAAAPVVCKGCGTSYPPDTVVCTTCGVNIKTGRPLITSRELDRDDVEKRIRIASYPLFFCIAPIASEGFGTKKPLAMWVIFGITVLVSILFFPALVANSPAARNSLLWVGSADARHQQLVALVQRKADEIERREQMHDDEPGPQNQFEYDPKEHAVQQAVSAIESEQSDEMGQFQWYQLLTHALLHGGWSHLVGNMLFLLVFGVPVNEVLGNVKTAIVYPLLAIGAGGIYAIVMHNQPLAPMLGASGAIMGLAGMYFVLFPAQKMHMAIWLRLWIPLVYRPITLFFWYWTWRMRGFWMLLAWIALSDIRPVIWPSTGDHVAHWAHLGGFVTGATIALLLLFTRQIHAHGGDILSVVLGPRAWALIGKPTDREVHTAESAVA
jgi:membrane associated rhomboid family serine protease/pSer/pThr/pTyr-binding forkhead associated (FHA) protein